MFQNMYVYMQVPKTSLKLYSKYQKMQVPQHSRNCQINQVNKLKKKTAQNFHFLINKAIYLDFRKCK